MYCLIQDPSLKKRVIPVKYDASLHKKDVTKCLVSSNYNLDSKSSSSANLQTREYNLIRPRSCFVACSVVTSNNTTITRASLLFQIHSVTLLVIQPVKTCNILQ